jgi:hypothetical protein
MTGNLIDESLSNLFDGSQTILEAGYFRRFPKAGFLSQTVDCGSPLPPSPMQPAARGASLGFIGRLSPGASPVAAGCLTDGYSRL